VRLWNTHSASEVARYEGVLAQSVSCVTMSRDGTKIVCGGDGNFVGNIRQIFISKHKVLIQNILNYKYFFAFCLKNNL
jgi:hypothetical protein